MAAVPAETMQLQSRVDALARELDDREKIWASGYLAGLAAVGQGGETAARQPAAAQSASPARVLNIWYGSETGNARRVAEQLADDARGRGLSVALSSLADVRPRDIRKQELLTLVVSTHGEGDPPEDAEAFHEFITADNAPRLEQLQYAVFSLGDSSYAHFCQTGRDLDEALQRLGAQPVLDRVDADVDFEEEAGQWREQALSVFEEKTGDGEAPETAESGSHLQLVENESRQWTRDHPFEAEVLAADPLTVAPSGKTVQHLELSLEGSGITYEAGDSVGVWPENPPALVEEVLELLGLPSDHRIERDGETRTAAEWLGRSLELTRLSRPFLEKHAEAVGSEALSAIVADTDGLRDWIAERQVVDILREFPGAVDGETVIRNLSRLTPRMYSIASSPSETPDELHLTVVTVGGYREDGLRAGAASWHLNSTLQAGDRVRLFVEPNPRFGLPESGDTPLILIGPGTGIAPFRAFIRERRERGEKGENWLFFGERHRRTDFLYQLEWQRHLRDGDLARLSLAFSRDQDRKIYVQDRIREAGTEFNRWLENGAHVYVCGDATRMAPDVDAAIVDVIAAERGLSEDEAAAELKTLRREGRYRKDVY